MSELSKQLKIGKSTVHGITSAFEEIGVLVRDPNNKKYSIGFTLLELRKKAYGKMELRDVAKTPHGEIDGENRGDSFSRDIKWRPRHDVGYG